MRVLALSDPHEHHIPSIRYAPLIAGPISLTVKLNNVDVLGSPLRLEVAPGPTQLAKCRISGDGVSTCHVREKAHFTIFACDAYGNQQPRGGDRFAVELQDHAGSQPVMRDEGDGSYTVEYVCEKLGNHLLSLMTADGGHHMPGSPYSIRCLPGSPFLPNCTLVSAHHGARQLSSASGPLTSTVSRAGEAWLEAAVPAAHDGALHLGQVSACLAPLRVVVKLVDRFGVTTSMSSTRQVQLVLLPWRKVEGGEVVESEQAPPGKKSSRTETNAHEAREAVWVASNWTTATMAEACSSPAGLPMPSHGSRSALAGSPAGEAVVTEAQLLPKVPPLPDALEGAAIATLSKSSGVGLSGERDLASADSPLLIKGGELEEEAVFQGLLEVTKAGKYRLMLCGSKGRVFGKTLAKVEVVAGKASPSRSVVVVGDGPQRGYVNQPVDFWLRARDAAGNCLTKGGERVNVAVKGPSHSQGMKVVVRDERDGSYAVKFVPPASGQYSLTVAMGREQVPHPSSRTSTQQP